MLDFPSTGLIPGTTVVTGPSGQVWRWDGVKWIAIVGGGGTGGGTGAAPGVSDGGNAGPGMIGENFNLQNSFVNALPGNVNGTINALTTQFYAPGDWDATMFVWLTGLGATATGDAVMRFATVGPNDVIKDTTISPVLNGECNFQFGPVRLSRGGSNGTVSASVTTRFTAFTSPAVQASFRARRMR